MTTCDLCKREIPLSEGPYIHKTTKPEESGWCCEKCWEANFDDTGYLDKKRKGLDTRVSVLSIKVEPQVKVKLTKLEL